RDKAPYGGGSGMPCGACREFLMQLSEKNKKIEIMVYYDNREIIKLEDLISNWWGDERYTNDSLEK
ncbi:cytidine deaminase, partial [Clostridium saudiense]|nr:cytidine deaminase [Clostridium saudiense]